MTPGLSIKTEGAVNDCVGVRSSEGSPKGSGRPKITVLFHKDTDHSNITVS